jgi:TRAP-type C4-dicarboxylate transport system permease small subunit
MKRINDLLFQFCKTAIMIMVPSMLVIIFAQVVLRYVFLSPFSWAEELARYLLIWISCLGAAYALREGLHISIIFIKRLFPSGIRTVFAFFVHILISAFFVMCIIEGFKLAISQWIERTPAMQVPMTFPFMAIPLGFAILLMFNLEILIGDINRVRAGEKL